MPLTAATSHPDTLRHLAAAQHDIQDAREHHRKHIYDREHVSWRREEGDTSVVGEEDGKEEEMGGMPLAQADLLRHIKAAQTDRAHARESGRRHIYDRDSSSPISSNNNTTTAPDGVVDFGGRKYERVVGAPDLSGAEHHPQHAANLSGDGGGGGGGVHSVHGVVDSGAGHHLTPHTANLGEGGDGAVSPTARADYVQQLLLAAQSDAERARCSGRVHIYDRDRSGGGAVGNGSEFSEPSQPTGSGDGSKSVGGGGISETSPSVPPSLRAVGGDNNHSIAAGGDTALHSLHDTNTAPQVGF